MKKQKRNKRRSLTIKWAAATAFQLEVSSVEEVHAQCQNIIVVPFGVSDTTLFRPPQPPMAA
jgi:hypothetical protein